jgi:photosystem II stability/assembly factor-like uncharacterized protein
MKKLLLSFTLTGLLALGLGGTTSAQPATLASLAPTAAGSPSIFTPAWVALADQVVPTVSAINPASAPNDIDTHVTISGADFTAVMDGTGTVVVTSPTASLGSTALTDVTWVNSTTLTAKVPWGMDPGVYGLTVVNPDGGTASEASAFTVTQGIGQWNGGNLFGGEVRQILMKPGDPNTLYALAYGVVGLFRSRDAGEHWTHVGADVAIGNSKFAVDPHNPNWLYGFDYNGLHRSQDEGDTWTTVMPNHWPDGRSLNSPQVFVSPYDPQVLFISSFSSFGDPFGNSSGAYGLIKSTDGGASWQIVADMEGIPVQDVAFHPTDPSKMVLATSDARVFQSSDGGNTWSEVAKPSLSSLGYTGAITYNPYRTTEVWIASTATSGGIYKSTDAAFTDWKDVSPVSGWGSSGVTFTSADSVYVARNHSVDGGENWQWFGPIYGYGEMRFNPNNPQIGYLGDNVYGVQKTTDGGQTWQIKNQGLAGMVCNSMDVSHADPLRVYAAFGGMPGIYRSDDGANNWTFIPITGSMNVRWVREDPFNPQRLYVAADSGFYVSTNGGENWSDLGWNLPPSSSAGMPWAMAADPNHAGHLLVGMVSGSYQTGPGQLYTSSDYGVSWQAVTMSQDLAWINRIVFVPETPGLVYLATGGGVYRSQDSGTSWNRIDDLQQPDMQYAQNIAIATHPRPTLLVGAKGPYRSFDGGATWEKPRSSLPPGSFYTFVDGDSTRLYAATGTGLFFSSDAGDSWTPAAGALGRLQIMALGYANANGHTILYAATSGGTAGATSSTAAATPRTSLTTASTIRSAATSGGAAGATSSTAAETPRTSLATASGLVDAGIYRYVLLPPRTLAVVRAGGGTGTVTSSPAGINCGSTCSHAFAYGSSVSLSASPQAGSTFAGWSGACSGTGSCTLTMDAGRSVTATFTLQTRTLSVTKSGSGSGTVSSSPAGINCGSTCSHAFAYGSSVTLSASPQAGSTFAGWSGACSGTGSCTLTLNANTTVTGSFGKTSPPKVKNKSPQTKITKAKINSGKRMATFKFVGSGSVKPYRFQCKLDKKKYSSCRSGKTYKHLKLGKHTFRVRAKDHAGRVDKTPAIKKFKIKH